ncbi:MAG: NAD(P)-binding protein [Candidatus Sericytochromatia bacterium]
MKKIKIAGAGISGLTAGINLSKSGYEVEIFEKKDCVAKRFKGDFQGLENWTTEKDALEIIKNCGIDLNFKITPSYDFNVTSFKNNLKAFKSEIPLYYLIQRGTDKHHLDYNLYNQAINSGVKIHFNIKDLPNDINIMATGPQKSSAIILGINFKTNYKNTHLMLCNNDLAPKGYAYLLIVDGEGTIATAFMPTEKNANSYLEETINNVKKIFDIEMLDIKKFGTYGSFSTNNIYKKENKLYIGEAAGLQDFLFGFGLRYAFLSGFLAAKSIIENKDYPEMANNYFSDTIKASLVNRFLYEKLDNNKYDFMINKMLYVKDLNSFLRKRYNFNLKRRILYPFAKIKIKN